MTVRSTADLRPTERTFVRAMSRLEYGTFEQVKIERGELVLDPWPASVRDVKFGVAGESGKVAAEPYELRRQVVQFIECVRAIETGIIRVLDVRGGLPFGMKLEQQPVEGGDHA